MVLEAATCSWTEDVRAVRKMTCASVLPLFVSCLTISSQQMVLLRVSSAADSEVWLETLNRFQSHINTLDSNTVI